MPESKGDDGTGGGAPPPGVEPMMITMKNMDKYGLKVGDGLKDTLDYKIFNKQEVLDEIQKIGFYSDFHGFRDKIGKYPLDDILVIADPEEVYGQNWLLCVTKAAYERELAKIQDAEAAAKAAADAEAAGAAAEEAEAEAEAEAVYVEVPVISKAYTSATAAESEAEVELVRFRKTRPLKSWSIVRKRREFGRRAAFQDKEGGEAMAADFRQQRNPAFETTRKELHIGLQACPGVFAGHSDAGTQTTWHRPVNSAVQTAALSIPGNALEALAEPGVLEFLDRVSTRCEHALQQNETINIFQDELALLDEEEMLVVGSKGENEIRELKTFMDLEHSQNKSLVAVDWHPSAMSWVAAAAGPNLTFEARVDMSGNTQNAHVLLYNTAEFSSQIILESPQEITVFRWCPTTPGIIAAGCVTGQVMVFNIEAALRAANRNIERKGGGASAAGGGGGGGGGGDSDKAQRVKPEFMSSVDQSHKRAVRGLTWLPAWCEITHRNEWKKSRAEKVANQFVTVAGDGQVLVWDLRFRERGRRKSVGSGPAGGAGAGDKRAAADPPWNPHYRCLLTKPDGSGELGLSCFDWNPKDPSQPMYLGTEGGETVYAEWGPPRKEEGDGKKAPAAAAAAATDAEGEDGPPQRVQWVAQVHHRPISCVLRNPFFDDLVACVGDWSFTLWREGIEVPLFTAPAASTLVTCARWSPTRPAVLFVGKVDGAVDVWDLLDSSHKPALHAPVVSSPITSLEFRPKHETAKKQMLAVGDFNGNLHLLEIPQQLSRRSGLTHGAMEAYLKREAERVAYVAKRSVVRQREKQVEDAAREKEEAEKERKIKAEEALLEAEGLEPAQLAAQRDAAEKEKAEKEYQALEGAVRDMLGISEEYVLEAQRFQAGEDGEEEEDGAGAAGGGGGGSGGGLKGGLGDTVGPEGVEVDLGSTRGSRPGTTGVM